MNEGNFMKKALLILILHTFFTNLIGMHDETPLEIPTEIGGDLRSFVNAFRGKTVHELNSKLVAGNIVPYLDTQSKYRIEEVKAHRDNKASLLSYLVTLKNLAPLVTLKNLAPTTESFCMSKSVDVTECEETYFLDAAFQVREGLIALQKKGLFKIADEYNDWLHRKPDACIAPHDPNVLTHIFDLFKTHRHGKCEFIWNHKKIKITSDIVPGNLNNEHNAYQSTRMIEFEELDCYNDGAPIYNWLRVTQKKSRYRHSLYKRLESIHDNSMLRRGIWLTKPTVIESHNEDTYTPLAKSLATATLVALSATALKLYSWFKV